MNLLVDVAVVATFVLGWWAGRYELKREIRLRADRELGTQNDDAG